MKDDESRINVAFGKNGLELDIAFKVVIKSENPSMAVNVDMSYLPEPKIKESASGRITPMPLFDISCPTRNGDSVSEQYCNEKCGLRREKRIVQGGLIQHRSCAAWADKDHRLFTLGMIAKCPDESIAKVYKMGKA